ncbi:unnamed protein product [Closterium sp. NIES-65]|nr:unnamed protein product [Closterium sp. NIES-65]
MPAYPQISKQLTALSALPALPPPRGFQHLTLHLISHQHSALPALSALLAHAARPARPPPRRFQHLTFHRPIWEARDAPVAGQTGLIEALLFEVGDRARIGHTSPTGTRSFCCTPELVRKTGCNPGHLIVRPRDDDSKWPRVVEMHLMGNDSAVEGAVLLSPVRGAHASGVSFSPCLLASLSPPTQWPRVVEINFMGNDSAVEAAASEMHITRTGMYYLWFVICDKNLAEVSVTGGTVWKNPSGYLPGMMTPYLNFFGAMSIVSAAYPLLVLPSITSRAAEITPLLAAYLLLGLLWLVQYARFWRDVLQLQHCITAVLFLAMVEMAACVGAVRKAVSRVLILVVAMGFGVVRPHPRGALGQGALARGGGWDGVAVLNLVVAMGFGVVRRTLGWGGSQARWWHWEAAYLVAAEGLDVMQNVGAIDDLSSGERVILVLPVAVLDAAFILWIFTALSKTLATAAGAVWVVHAGCVAVMAWGGEGAASKQSAQHTSWSCTGASPTCSPLSVLISVAWIAYEIFFKVTDPFNERWQADWITGCFWHVLTFALLCIICILLGAPPRPPPGIAYSEDAPDEDDETVALTKAVATAAGEAEDGMEEDELEQGKLE